LISPGPQLRAFPSVQVTCLILLVVTLSEIWGFHAANAAFRGWLRASLIHFMPALNVCFVPGAEVTNLMLRINIGEILKKNSLLTDTISSTTAL